MMNQNKSERGVSVFVADDSCMIRERLQAMVSAFPSVAFIGEAEDAVQATHLIKQKNPDVAILDIMMPGGNGIDVIRRLGKVMPSCLWIVLTNHPDPEFREASFVAGADYFFDKSKDLDKLQKIFDVLNRISTRGYPCVLSEKSVF